MSWHVKKICGKDSPTTGLPSLKCFKSFHKWIDHSGLQSLNLKREIISIEKVWADDPSENSKKPSIQSTESTYSASNWSFSISGMSKMSEVL